jgi:hypothetical protein
MGMGGISLYRSGKATGVAWDVLKFLVEESRYARLIGLMPAPVADIEPWLRLQFKNVPSADPKVMLKVVELASGNTRMSAHPRYTDMQAIINPAMDDLMAGRVAPVPLLRRLKTQLQAVVDRRP